VKVTMKTIGMLFGLMLVGCGTSGPAATLWHVPAAPSTVLPTAVLTLAGEPITTVQSDGVTYQLPLPSTAPSTSVETIEISDDSVTGNNGSWAIVSVDWANGLVDTHLVQPDPRVTQN
jgi:hypothetical protein